MSHTETSRPPDLLIRYRGAGGTGYYEQIMSERPTGTIRCQYGPPATSLRVFCLFAVLACGTAFAQSPVAPVAPTAAQQLPPAVPAIDAHERLHWLYVENLGVGSVLDDIGVGAAETLINSPKEYETHWSGFGERVGMVTANYGVKSVMELSLGSIWGEDPRYFPTTGLTVKNRMAYVIRMTFLARNASGNTMPAYSRYLAIPGSSFLSNEWLPTSQATVNQALVRTALGFLSRMGENAWKEFVASRK
jgi:hypothetical protein